MVEELVAAVMMVQRRWDRMVGLAAALLVAPQ
jgi:hypothetical protein